MTDRIHLHLDDYPATLELLTMLANGRAHSNWIAIGYEITEHGAWINWEQLTSSWLSSTEKAVIHIARGCATLENDGGPPPRLRQSLYRAIQKVTPDPNLPPGWQEGGW